MRGRGCPPCTVFRSVPPFQSFSRENSLHGGARQTPNQVAPRQATQHVEGVIIQDVVRGVELNVEGREAVQVQLLGSHRHGAVNTREEVQEVFGASRRKGHRCGGTCSPCAAGSGRCPGSPSQEGIWAPSGAVGRSALPERCRPNWRPLRLLPRRAYWRCPSWSCSCLLLSACPVVLTRALDAPRLWRRPGRGRSQLEKTRDIIADAVSS